MQYEPPDEELDARESELVATLTSEQVHAIDEALFAVAHSEWRKVAYVVAYVMTNSVRVAGIPDIYYAQRVRVLVQNGRLEARGFLNRMRYCEVRIPDANVCLRPKADNGEGVG